MTFITFTKMSDRTQRLLINLTVLTLVLSIALTLLAPVASADGACQGWHDIGCCVRLILYKQEGTCISCIWNPITQEYECGGWHNHTRCTPGFCTLW